MDITEVKVFPIQEEKLKAFVSIVLDQCFMVNDIKIIQGRDGLFISMPSRKKKNGEFKDVAHPLNNETRRMIEDKVLGEYERVLAERGESLPQSSHPAHLGAPAAAPAHAIPLSPIPSLGARGAGVPQAAPATRSEPAAVVPAPAVPDEKTLEEVEEMHLRDSFWTVT